MKFGMSIMPLEALQPFISDFLKPVLAWWMCKLGR